MVVRQRPFWPSYSRERDFPWLYSDSGGYGYYSGWGGYDLVRQSLKTDSSGKAKLKPRLGTRRHRGSLRPGPDTGKRMRSLTTGVKRMIAPT